MKPHFSPNPLQWSACSLCRLSCSRSSITDFYWPIFSKFLPQILLKHFMIVDSEYKPTILKFSAVAQIWRKSAPAIL